MDLQNGYKVLYAEVADGNRVFKASTTGALADATEIASVEIGKYKLVYEKDGQIYGSETGVPAEGDTCFDAFDKVFKVATETPMAGAEEEEPVQEVAEDEGEPEAEDEEEPIEGEDEIEE